MKKKKMTNANSPKNEPGTVDYMAAQDRIYLVGKAMAHCRVANQPEPVERENQPLPRNHPLLNLYPPRNVR